MSVNKGGFGSPAARPASPVSQKPGPGEASSSSSSSLTPPAKSRHSLSEDGERVIASVRDRKVETQAIPAGRGLPGSTSPSAPEPPQLRRLSQVLGHAEAGSAPEGLRWRAFEHARGLDAAALALFIGEIALPACGHLDEPQRQALLQGITASQRYPGEPPIDLARLHALMPLLTQGAAVLSLAQQVEVLEALCFLSGAPAVELAHVEALVGALCHTTDLHDPPESGVLMQALASQLGGAGMEITTCARIELVIVQSGCLPEQLGAMVIGLADTLQDRVRSAAADSEPSHANDSYFAAVLGAAHELSAPQLARWGLGCAVSTRMDLDGAAEELGAAVLTCGGILTQTQLTALGLGIATGLGDGRVGKSIVDRLWPVLESADADVSEPFYLGLAMAVDPMAGIVRAESPAQMARWVYALPRVLNVRTAVQQLDSILALRVSPQERVALLQVLLEHAGRHLEVPAFRKARDEVLRHAPDQLGPLYAAFAKAGLPPQVFDPASGTPPGTGDGLELSAARRTILDRLAFVWQESAFVSASATSPANKEAALAVLGQLETALSVALPPADVKAAAARVSAPATR